MEKPELAQQRDTREGRSSPDAMRSSPPVEGVEADVSEETPRPSKERSLEEMDVEPQDGLFPSSATMVGDVASSAEPVETSGQTEQMKLKTVAHNMSPPPVPSFSIQQPFRTPPSAQPPQKQKAEQSQQTEPIPAEPKRMPSRERPKTPESDDPDTQLDDPQDRIADFDWIDLQHRYHDRMKELNQEEEDAMDEFRRLCQVRNVRVKAAQMLTRP